MAKRRRGFLRGHAFSECPLKPRSLVTFLAGQESNIMLLLYENNQRNIVHFLWLFGWIRIFLVCATDEIINADAIIVCELIGKFQR